MKPKTLLKVILIIVILTALMRFTIGQPSGATIDSNTTETKTPAAAEFLNTSGGTFTTLILSGETQNLRWKAYAGNVSGTLVLDDASDLSIYQWQQTSFSGEVYATRNNSITWSTIRCANLSNIAAEETAMNHTTANVDSINSTFFSSIHQGFFVGAVQIGQSTCRSTFTFVNDTAQTPSVNAPFQEVLLHDTSHLVYATFIDDNTQGFNFNDYDFQMIVAENSDGNVEATRYYFYMELQ